MGLSKWLMPLIHAKPSNGAYNSNKVDVYLLWIWCTCINDAHLSHLYRQIIYVWNTFYCMSFWPLFTCESEYILAVLCFSKFSQNPWWIKAWNLTPQGILAFSSHHEVGAHINSEKYIRWFEVFHCSMCLLHKWVNGMHEFLPSIEMHKFRSEKELIFTPSR